MSIVNFEGTAIRCRRAEELTLDGSESVVGLTFGEIILGAWWRNAIVLGVDTGKHMGGLALPCHV